MIKLINGNKKICKQVIIKQFCCNKFYEVVIQGSGPVGLTLACTLAQHDYFKSLDKQNMKILIIDQQVINNNNKYREQTEVPD